MQAYQQIRHMLDRPSCFVNDDMKVTIDIVGIHRLGVRYVPALEIWDVVRVVYARRDAKDCVSHGFGLLGNRF